MIDGWYHNDNPNVRPGDVYMDYHPAFDRRDPGSDERDAESGEWDCAVVNCPARNYCKEEFYALDGVVNCKAMIAEAAAFMKRWYGEESAK
jgi:hypothetical protein